MDPLTSLGLAANILQFVQVGSKICSNARQLHKSKTGELDHTTYRRETTQQLSTATRQISTQLNGNGRFDPLIRRSCDACQEISDQIISILDRISLDSQRDGVLQRLFKGAVAVWKEDDIRNLEGKLRDVQFQLNTQLVAAFWSVGSICLSLYMLHQLTVYSDQQSEIKIFLQELVDGHTELQIRNAQDLKEITDKITFTVRHNAKADLESDVISLHSEATRMKREQAVLQNLVYPGMTRRISTIPDPYSGTFSWIFQDTSSEATPCNRFNHWLMYESGSFWIAGKAGSGKSTLMKHIFQAQQTKDSLKEWAGTRDLIVASHFFWNAGTSELEKTQEGLLRALLYDVCRQIPDLIPIVLRKGWRGSRVELFDESWFLKDLLVAFNALIEYEFTNEVLCFFIDGLDEYEGDQVEFTRLLQRASRNPNIKMCLSSRPWAVFSEAFGRQTGLGIMLQDFTSEDIRCYVRRNLNECNGHLERESLIEEVVHRAQGVFLWIYLVVRSLVRGIVNGDSPLLLLQRVRHFPSDLEKYFTHMLNNIEEIYQANGAMFLLMCQATTKPLSLLAVEFIDASGSLSGINDCIGWWPQNRSESNAVQLTKQLGAHCGDLLELGRPKGFSYHDGGKVWNYTIEFLHRTVRDFLASSKIQDLLISRCRVGERPHRCLIQNAVGQTGLLCKEMKFGYVRTYQEYFSDLVTTAVDAAKHEEVFDSEPNTRLLNTIGANLQAILEFNQSLPATSENMQTSISKMLMANITSTTFFYIAITKNLLLYINDKVEQEPWLLSDARPPDIYSKLKSPLDAALHSFHEEVAGPEETDMFERIKMVELLLEKGADPNSVDSERYEGPRTTWVRFLVRLDQSTSDLNQYYYKACMKLLLRYGADPNLVVDMKLDFKEWWMTHGERTTARKRTIEGIVRSKFSNIAHQVELLDELHRYKTGILRSLLDRLWIWRPV